MYKQRLREREQLFKAVQQLKYEKEELYSWAQVLIINDADDGTDDDVDDNDENDNDDDGGGGGSSDDDDGGGGGDTVISLLCSLCQNRTICSRIQTEMFLDGSTGLCVCVCGGGDLLGFDAV